MPVEHLALHLAHVLLETIDDRLVAIHHLVDDGMQHGAGAERQAVGLALQTGSHVDQFRGRLVPHVENGTRSDEHLDLAEVDVLLAVEVLGRPEHQEERIAVLLQLGSLVR